MRIQYKAFSILLLCLSTHAKAVEKTVMYHIVQLPLQPLSITCEMDSIHEVYKINLRIDEATINPPIDSLFFSLFSNGPEGSYVNYKDCIGAVRDIHRRYPNGSSFHIRRTIEEWWEPGCLNDRCPKKRHESETITGSFDGRTYSNSQWD